jgi:hypothetical protein
MKPSDDKIDCPAFFLNLYFPLTAISKELFAG